MQHDRSLARWLHRADAHLEPAALAGGITGIFQGEEILAPVQHVRDALPCRSRLVPSGLADRRGADRSVVDAQRRGGLCARAIGLRKVFPGPIDGHDGGVGIEHAHRVGAGVQDRLPERLTFSQRVDLDAAGNAFTETGKCIARLRTGVARPGTVVTGHQTPKPAVDHQGSDQRRLDADAPAIVDVDRRDASKDRWAQVYRADGR